MAPNATPPHATANEIREYLGEEKFNAYHTFAVIRNPIERAYSLYTYPLRNPHVINHKEVKGMRDFDEFCLHLCRKGNPTQLSQITDQNGKILINELILFENLIVELGTLSKKLNIPIAIDHRNQSRGMLETLQIRPETRERLTEYFNKDLTIYNSLIKQRLRSNPE